MEFGEKVDAYVNLRVIYMQMLWKLIRLNEIMWAITPDSLSFGNQDALLVNEWRDEEELRSTLRQKSQ